jgi:hypothetical protein
MAAFFNLHLPPVGMSLGAAMLHVGRRRVAHPSNRFAAAAVRIAAVSGELGLFLGMLFAVALLLVVMAGFFA